MNHLLLQKASIITTPTAYAEDYLYSIKPAYALGSELVANGNFSNGSTDWTLVGDFQINNSIASISNASQYSQITSQQGNAFLSTGKTYKLQADITSSINNALAYRVQGGAVTPISLSEIVNGKYTAYFTMSQNGYFWFQTTGSYTGLNATIDNVSVKEITDADFDFDRNSTGTRVNKDDLIEDVPYNLLAYSQDFTQWTNSNSTDSVSTTLSPDGSSFSTNFAENTSNAQHKLTRSVSFDGSSTYTFSVFVKSNGRDIYLDVGNNTRFGGRASFNLTTGVASTVMGTPSIKNLGNGWFRCMVTGASTSAGSTTLELLTFNGSTNSYEGDGSSGVFVWGAQVVKGNQPKDYLKTTDRLDIPRIDFTSAVGSILLEPSKTNLATYSKDFSQWSTISASATDDYATSPEGITNASRFLTTSTGAYLYLSSISVSNSTEYTISVYAKSNGNSLDDFRIYTSIGDSSTLTATSQWQRFTYTFTTSTTSINIGFRPSGTQNADIQIYGYQIEEGSYSTSLIHTSGSTVTRSADISNNAGNSDLINSPEGVLYLEVAFNNESNNHIGLSDGTSNNRVTFTSSGTINRFKGVVKVGGVSSFSGHATAIDNTQNFNKYAIKWKENDFALWCNGTERNTDTSGSTFSAGTLTTLQFDRGDGANDFHGKVKVLAVFKEALTDAELTTLTS